MTTFQESNSSLEKIQRPLAQALALLRAQLATVPTPDEHSRILANADTALAQLVPALPDQAALEDDLVGPFGSIEALLGRVSRQGWCNEQPSPDLVTRAVAECWDTLKAFCWAICPTEETADTLLRTLRPLDPLIHSLMTEAEWDGYALGDYRSEKTDALMQSFREQALALVAAHG